MYDYGPIKLFVRKSLPDGYIVHENSPITVLNGTNVVGFATREGDDLKTFGYNIVTVANASKKNFQKTTLVDLSGGKDKYTKHYLELRFGVKAVAKLPATIQNDGSHFILILGSDETAKFNKIKPAKGYSAALHVGLVTLLPLVLFVLARLGEQFIGVSFALILLSKWRMFAVRPRFWAAIVRANSIDLMVGVSTVIFLQHSSSSTWLQRLWATTTPPGC